MERLRETLERIAGNMRPLVEHMAAQERRMRLCPICRCEYVLEWHDEDCSYNDARDALALLDRLTLVADAFDEPRHVR